MHVKPQWAPALHSFPIGEHRLKEKVIQAETVLTKGGLMKSSTFQDKILGVTFFPTPGTYSAA